MEPIKTGFGKINWIDSNKRTGVIAQEEGERITKLPFRFDDVEVGTPSMGQKVQFVIDATDATMPVAKHIYIISDLAKQAPQSKYKS